MTPDQCVRLPFRNLVNLGGRGVLVSANGDTIVPYEVAANRNWIRVQRNGQIADLAVETCESCRRRGVLVALYGAGWPSFRCWRCANVRYRPSRLAEMAAKLKRIRARTPLVKPLRGHRLKYLRQIARLRRAEQDLFDAIAEQERNRGLRAVDGNRLWAGSGAGDSPVPGGKQF